jgi:hypothetical protein
LTRRCASERIGGVGGRGLRREQSQTTRGGQQAQSAKPDDDPVTHALKKTMRAQSGTSEYASALIEVASGIWRIDAGLAERVLIEACEVAAATRDPALLSRVCAAIAPAVDNKTETDNPRTESKVVPIFKKRIGTTNRCFQWTNANKSGEHILTNIVERALLHPAQAQNRDTGTPFLDSTPV